MKTAMSLVKYRYKKINFSEIPTEEELMNLSPDTIQLGGFLINIFMALIAIIASLISYAIYSDSSSPDVITYLEQDKEVRTVMNLVIKNVGRGAAKNVKFKKHVTNLNQENKKIDQGILASGIPYLAPGAERVIMLGSYHELESYFNNAPVKVDVIYSRAKSILFFSRKIEASSYLDINSFSGVFAGDNSNENKIYKELGKIRGELSRINKTLNGETT
ncbi:hypothetical protein [Serratia fonticola]